MAIGVRESGGKVSYSGMSADTGTHTHTGNALRTRLRVIIFEAETTAGRAFDVALLWAIGMSILIVMLDSMEEARQTYGDWLAAGEWTFTILFSLEYAIRLWVVRSPFAYARSFYGIVDLLSITPAYLGLFFGGAHSLIVIRSLRLLRIFRVLKLAQFMGEAHVLVTALRRSRRKILVFLGSITVLVFIMGAVMYLVEGPKHGFTSIPRGVYWAIVTLTTVGYGDIHPHTPLGQALAAMVMILGYAVIAVPTGIVSVELNEAMHGDHRACPACGEQGHELDSRFCRHCGAHLAKPDKKY